MGKFSFLIFGPVLLLAGCGGNSAANDQLVASGRTFEITVPELDQLLRSAPPVTRDEVLPARRAILDKLIDDKLFAEAAAKEQLDREPETMQQIEAARRQILSQAYVSVAARKLSEPSDRQIQDFYNANLKLFVNRTSITIDQLTPTGTPAQIANYRGVFDRSGLDGLQQAMAKAGQIVAPSRSAILDSQLPPGQSEAITKLAPGSQIAFNDNGLLHLAVIKEVNHGTLLVDDARGEIIARLKVSRLAAMLKADAQQLRAEHEVKVNDNLVAGKAPGAS